MSGEFLLSTHQHFELYESLAVTNKLLVNFVEFDIINEDARQRIVIKSVSVCNFRNC